MPVSGDVATADARSTRSVRRAGRNTVGEYNASCCFKIGCTKLALFRFFFSPPGVMLVSTVFARPAALPSLPNNGRGSGQNDRRSRYATSRQRPQPTDADPGTAPGPRYGTTTWTNHPQPDGSKRVIRNWLCFAISCRRAQRRSLGSSTLRIARVSSVSVGR